MKHLRFYEVLKTMNPGVMPYWAHMPTNNALEKLWPLSIRPRVKQLPGWYGEYLSSIEWRERRAVVLILSMYKCNRCDGRAHIVHHLTYDRRGEEHLSDLEPLCRRCHDITHGRKRPVQACQTAICNILSDVMAGIESRRSKAPDRARREKV